MRKAQKIDLNAKAGAIVVIFGSVFLALFPIFVSMVPMEGTWILCLVNFDRAQTPSSVSIEG